MRFLCSFLGKLFGFWLIYLYVAYDIVGYIVGHLKCDLYVDYLPSYVVVILMDDDGLRNWGYYEPSFKEHLGLQLMSPMGDNRDTKPFLNPRENLTMVNPNGPAYNLPHTRILSESPLPMNYMRDGWIQRERLYHHMLPTNPNFPLIPNTLTSNSIHMMPPIEMSNVEENEDVKKESGGSGGGSSSGVGGSIKKRGPATATTTPKTPRTKKQKKTPKQNGPKTVKKNIEVVINGIDMDISGIPIPVCTCTGSPQQCYRWGLGGWQSACCTTTISIYPLPMSTKRRGARIAGRKMSQGAFKKVLERLASEGYNFANAIDLKTYWAKHGTNKFVTIR